MHNIQSRDTSCKSNARKYGNLSFPITVMRRVSIIIFKSGIKKISCKKIN